METLRAKLNAIRPGRPMRTAKKVTNTLLVALLGVALGVLAKLLDLAPGNALPGFFEALDLRNFFSRTGVWLFLGAVLALFSASAPRAALNAFVFFLGMVGAYFGVTVFVGGFFPRAYMFFWLAVTALTPFLGFVCFYGRGEHPLSIGIAAVLLALLARQAFAFGFWYFDLLYPLEAVLLVGMAVLLYRSPKQMLLALLGGAVLFFVLSPLYLGIL